MEENLIKGVTENAIPLMPTPNKDNKVFDLKQKNKVENYLKLLDKIVEQICPLDFKTLAFPESQEIKSELENLQRLANKDAKTLSRIEYLQEQLKGFKLKAKHYRLLCVENLLKTAKEKKFGFCKNNDFVYIYNGAYWVEIDPNALEMFLVKSAIKMGINKFDSKDITFRRGLFELFHKEAYLPTPEPPKDKVLINLQNGTFEISPQGTKLRPFDRSDFITYQLPFEYDPQAKAPIFEAYLNRVLPDPERQRVLAEYLGFVFIRHGSKVLKEEKALVLYGTGQNGKSVFFEIVNALLGTENVSCYSLQSLTNDNGYFRAKIANKLVNYASEINGNLEASTFKQLVSGEPVEARLPYGEPFVLRQYAKLIFNCNELPKDVEHTPAYFRRFLIVPFDVVIPENEKDTELHTKIIDNELAGVFNWVLQGLKRLLNQKKFSECKASQNALEQYKAESNSVQMFLQENEYKSSARSYKLIKDLYPQYRNFCMEEGAKPFKKTNFVKQLKALGFVVDRVSQNQLAVFLEVG